MKIDIEDVLFWMDAIRDSDDRYRTLESFWKGQIRSKIWLIEKLKDDIDHKNHRIVIHGGWNGVLSSLLFNSDIKIEHITSVDINPICEKISSTVNKRQEIKGKFKSITQDMCYHFYNADIVVNTSCEHITDNQISLWFSNIPTNSLVVMQSNNYFGLDEHINCVNNENELAKKVDLKDLKKFKFETPKYTRFMIIGRK
jgi:hypothetical protein